VVDENGVTFPPTFPMSQIAIYCGWYDNNVSGPFTRAHVEFMPGAFAYHIQSFSAANLRSATLNWVGPLLAKGATISMGAVAEPYLAGTPDMAVFVGRLVVSGFSFGESAYASQGLLSWQTTVVGDPLYRPFAKPPSQLHEALERRHNKLIAWSYLRLVNLNLDQGAPAGAMVDYLEHIYLTRQSAVLTEKLADLYGAQGKPSSAIQTYEAALKLDASPQQRVRLRLTLEDKFLALNRVPEAYANLEKLLLENTDYPDQLGIYRKLLSLAQKLGKTNDAARYEEIVRSLSPPPPPPPPKQ
jgi:hypothetical protein